MIFFYSYLNVSYNLSDAVMLFNINEARSQRMIIENFNDMEILLIHDELNWERYSIDRELNYCELVIITTKDMFHRFGRSTEIYIPYKTEISKTQIFNKN